MHIQYYRKNVYGRETMYVVPGLSANAIKGLTGKETIASSDMAALGALGHTFTEVLAPRPVTA